MDCTGEGDGRGRYQERSLEEMASARTDTQEFTASQ